MKTSRTNARGFGRVVWMGVTAIGPLTMSAIGYPSAALADNSGNQYISVDAVDSEYWNEYIQGAQGIVESVGKHGNLIASNYNGAQLIAQYQAIFSAGCSKCAIAGDASGGAFVKPWVERAEKAGAYVVTVWSRANDIHPWNTAPKAWVAHTSFDGVRSGYEQTKALCEAMKGTGGLAAIKGAPDAAPAPQRIKGMKEALAKEQICKNVKLLAMEVGNWEETKAQGIVRAWVARFGDQLNAVMASNDGMARGAIAALREKGLNGKVFVTGSDGASDALNEIKAGDLQMTMWNDPVLQGAVAMSIAYAASIGDIDPSKLSEKQRDFYMNQEVVNPGNVDKFLALKKDHPKFTYEQMKGHWFDYIESQIPPNANNPKQDE
jgi:ribose transport system substrate-binding protein